MANNVTLHQKNKDGAYDNIYPRTTANHTMLTSATGNKYGLTDGNAEQAVSISMDFISTIGAISMYVFDPLGNPVEGAVVQGLSGNPSTNASGFVQGTVVDNPVTVKSPYVDLKDKSVNVTSYVGTTTAMRVTLESLGENGIVRFTRSTNVKFSHVTKTVDVCCVGGGGGGGKLIKTSSGGETYYNQGGGGGGGAIVNSYSKPINADTDYILSVGSGGASGYTGGAGGTTTFLSVSATGGGGAYVYRPSGSSSPIGKGGSAGSPGSGKGGDYGYNGENSTISEFDDGVTFYSGGGGAGNKKGGTPNGANGAYITGGYPGTSTPHAASNPGIGGGGGGATFDFQITANLPSSGGPGLVAIRIHLS